MRARNYLFGHFKAVAKAYAFQEYDAPVLEHEELYKRKAGEEITQQMYNFVDKEGHAVTLRPEMTPTLARMILARTNESGETKMLLPVKWFSLPQCWRFETTQRGRKREHYQWNMDIVGVKSIAAEVELLSAITAFFINVGITSKDVGIKVNSRKVMASILKAQGISDEQFAPVCVVVDKLDKIGDDAVTEELMGLGVKEATARTIIKTMSARSVEELASIAQGADQEGLNELKDLFEQAKAYGYEDFLLFDASVVRGLAYYTGIVFECFDRTGELRAICGGGRYDRLLSLYGSKQEVPCVGFGFGDCVIMELLQVICVLLSPSGCLCPFVSSYVSLYVASCGLLQPWFNSEPSYTLSLCLSHTLSHSRSLSQMKNLLPSFQQETDFVVAAFSNDMLPNAMKVPANAPARLTPACGPHHYAPKKNAITPRVTRRALICALTCALICVLIPGGGTAEEGWCHG